MREKFEKLERNTDGILKSLIDATRKLALVEGGAIGRAEQLEEQSRVIHPTAEKTTVTSSETINTVTSEVKK